MDGTEKLDWASLFRRSDLEEIEDKLRSDAGTLPVPRRFDEYGNTRTHLAAAYSSLPVLLHFLEKHGADEVNYYGQTLLMSACMDTKLEKVRHLVDTCGCDVHLTDYCGNTALHVAAALSSIPVIEYLLSKGADLSKENGEGLLLMTRISKKSQWEQINGHYRRGIEMSACYTKAENPITIACTTNSSEVCEYLVTRATHEGLKVEPSHLLLRSCFDSNLDKVKYFHESGGSVNYKEDVFTPLHLAAQLSTLNIVEYLIEEGAQVGTMYNTALTTFHSAAYGGKKENLEVLVKHKTDYVCNLSDSDMWSLLHAAATCSGIETLELIVNNLVDISHISEAPFHVLHQACKDKNLEKIIYLCENLPEAAINHKLETGETALHNAARWSSLEVVKYLISRGADIYAKDTYECSIFHWASLGSSTQIVEYLLDFGFDINGTDKTGETPLMKAAWTGSLEMMRVLMAKGANLDNNTTNDCTLMHSACSWKKVENVRFLHHNHKIFSFDVNSRDKNNFPAFMRAITSGYANMPMLNTIKILGADFSLCTNNGETALHKACNVKSLQVIQFLLQNGLAIDKKNNNGRTPLQCAAENSSVEVLDFLCGVPNRLEMLDDEGNNLLHWSSCGKFKENIEFFIKKGIDVQTENDNGEKPMHLAARNGTKETLEYLISCGASVIEANRAGQRPLRLACMHKTVDRAKALLEHGAEINLADSNKDGETALHIAASRSEHIELIRYLLEKGADINQRDGRGKSVLHSAAYGKDTKIMEEFVKYGLPLDDKDDDGNTVISTACAFGSTTVIGYLLDRKLSLLDRNKFEKTPLHYLHLNDVSVIEYLTKREISFTVTTDKGETPVHEAAMNGALDHVKAFIEKANMDIFSKTNEGNTLLHCACEGKNVKLLEYLVELIDVHATNNDNETPIHAAAKKGTTEIVDFLLKRGADINGAGNSKFTPLHYAVDHGDLDVVKLFVNAGADINLRGGREQTILHAVAGTRHVEVAEYVISLGIDLELTEKDGATAAFYAAGYGSKEMLSLFIGKKANLSAKTTDNLSLLHMAAKENVKEIVELLLQNESDIAVKESNGKRPLHYSVLYKTDDNAKVLLDAGSDINWRDNKGNTALHDVCAAEGDMQATVETLHKAGASLDALNVSAETPLIYAILRDAEKNTNYLLDNGADINHFTRERVTPILAAFRNASAPLIKTLVRRGADMHVLDSNSNPAFASCRQEMEKEFLLYHVLEENLSLDGMLKSIKQWGAIRYNKGLVWYSFAGGSVKDVISIAQLEHLSEQQINLVLVSDPLFLNNHKEAILLETSLKPDNYSGLSLLMEEKMKSVPQLQEFCRTKIRKLILRSGSIFPIAKKMKSEVLLTRSALNFTFLIDEMSSIESDIHKDLISFLTKKDASPMSVDFKTPKDATPEPATSDFWQLLFTKQTTEQPDVLLVQDILEWSTQSDSPRWILDGVAGTCPDGLYRDATSHNPTEESEKFVLGYLRLYNTFLSLLKQRDGPCLSGKGYGSYFAGTQVMDLDEMDFMAIQHDEDQEITHIDGPGYFFHVRKPLSKQHDYAGTMKQYIYQALREYLKGEKRPEDPSTGQVFVQACYPYPVAPAVCTVFAWQCFSGHRHHISVDLTPAIIWKDKKLSDIYCLPQALNREPFLAAKQDLESLPPMLIPSPVSHVECLDHYITSSWELSFCNTKDIMWRVLDGVSGNIRLLFKQVKVIRNHILPYILKFSPGTDPEKGSWQGGCVVSSWVLYNILLQQVLIHPAGSCWEDPGQRLLSYLDSLLHWRYYEFFTGKEEHSTKWSDTEPKLRHLLLEQMTDDINRVKLSIRASDDVTYSLEEMISQISRLHEKESVLVAHYSCNHGDDAEGSGYHGDDEMGPGYHGDGEESPGYHGDGEKGPGYHGDGDESPGYHSDSPGYHGDGVPGYHGDDEVPGYHGEGPGNHDDLPSLTLHCVGMGRLRFDTDDVVSTLGITSHSVCYYKCPKVQRKWLSDPLYSHLLYIIYDKFARCSAISPRT